MFDISHSSLLDNGSENEKEDDEANPHVLTEVTPEIIQEASDVDRLIAQKLSKMSIQDREKIDHDIHGISTGVKETPEFISDSLLKLEKELVKLNGKLKKEYELAKKLDKDYVQNKNFRLKFLRADKFNTRKAACRIARHFKAKVELFGEDKVVKNIVQDDLTESDMDALNYGAPSVLPLRDRSGRVVCLWIPRSEIQEMPSIAKLRVSFYVAQVLSEDIETQKKGCVCVLYLVGNKGDKRDIEAEWKIASLSMAVPLRSEAQYFCYDSWQSMPMAFVLKYGCSAFNSVRFRSQYGNQNDIMFWLQTFGIPTKLMPLSVDGDINFDQNIDTWEKRRILERTNSSQKIRHVGVPARFDVLLGRGKACHEHPGNVRFRHLVEEFTSTYHASSKNQKTKVTREILTTVKESSGRFLKESDSGWVEVDTEVARLKVSHAFRDIPRLPGKNNNGRVSKRELPLPLINYN